MNVKVKELIEQLQKFDGERIVILQKDAEGNGFSPLHAADDNCRYIADTTWCGEVKAERLTPEMIQRHFSEEDITTRGVPCVVLAPIN